METIKFYVHGLPTPQGSARAFMAGGRPVITSANKNLGDWRRLIADASQKHAQMLAGPISLQLRFYLPRPKSTPKKTYWPAKRPDLDKLIRAVGDALTGIMWADDSQICVIYALKFYADKDHPPGVDIGIWGDAT